MPSWDELLSELNPVTDSCGRTRPGLTIDELRRKYVRNLSDVDAGRNVITYYSGWLRQECDNPDFEMNDSDMTGFMNAVKGMDMSKGLDLVLHTPGGSPTAVEGIVKYLHSEFGNDEIRVIVPHMAMSAGTMLACSAKEIIMGLHSSLGPIYPRIKDVSMYNVLQEFRQAEDELKEDPSRRVFWEIELKNYPLAYRNRASDDINLSAALVREWLKKYMFAKEKDSRIKIDRICNVLNSGNQSPSRHFCIDDCREMGLKVVPLEGDEKLQDAVLSLHHAYTISFDRSKSVKIIENQLGKAYIVNRR